MPYRIAAMTKTPLALLLTLLFAAGCDRNAPPDLVRGSGAPPPASALPPIAAQDGKQAEPAKGTSSGTEAARKPSTGKASAGKAATRKPAAAAAGRAWASNPSRDNASIADDPCAGLDGRELDDCLGYEEAGEPENTREFAAEQRRRDRELLERDAEEAARRARELEEEANVPEDDEDLPPEEDAPADDYDPRYDGDQEDEPPPEDDGNW